jgi:hypothetical protein
MTRQIGLLKSESQRNVTEAVVRLLRNGFPDH